MNWQGLTIRTRRSEMARHRDHLRGVDKHHGFPQYLGGAYSQRLVRLPKRYHYLYHQELNDELNRIARLPRGKRNSSRYYRQLTGPQMMDVLQRVVGHAWAFDQRYRGQPGYRLVLPALLRGIRQSQPLEGRRWPSSAGRPLPPPLPRGIQSQSVPSRMWPRSLGQPIRSALRRGVRLASPLAGRRLVRSLGRPRRQREAFSQSLLQYGSRGPTVQDLQHWLNQWLMRTGRPILVVDGIFGSRVESAVQAFQRARGLTVDGIVGSQTSQALRTVTAPHSPPTQSSSTSTVQLAQQVLNHSGITLWSYSPIASGTSDGADALNNIRDAASGLTARRSSYGNAPGGTVSLKSRILQGMLALANDYNIRVTSIAGGSHSPTSRHYAGVAFDVDKINGSPVNSSNPYYQAFMQRCRALGATEVLGPGDSGHNTHVHCAWPR